MNISFLCNVDQHSIGRVLYAQIFLFVESFSREFSQKYMLNVIQLSWNGLPSIDVFPHIFFLNIDNFLMFRQLTFGSGGHLAECIPFHFMALLCISSCISSSCTVFLAIFVGFGIIRVFRTTCSKLLNCQLQLRVIIVFFHLCLVANLYFILVLITVAFLLYFSSVIQL